MKIALTILIMLGSIAAIVFVSYFLGKLTLKWVGYENVDDAGYCFLIGVLSTLFLSLICSLLFIVGKLIYNAL